MRSEEGHDGLNEGQDDADDADGRMGVPLQGLGVKGLAFDGRQDDGKGRQGEENSQAHAELVKPECHCCKNNSFFITDGRTK